MSYIFRIYHGYFAFTDQKRFCIWQSHKSEGIISFAVKKVKYSPRDNFSPESEGSVKPKTEAQSRV